MLRLVFLGTLVLIDGAVLFARNDLLGMPELQEKLMTLIVWVSFLADVNAYPPAPAALD